MTLINASSSENSKKYIGIDFGTKRIGVAVSDDAGSMAFPKQVMANEKRTPDELLTMCRALGVEDVILGESKNFKGEDNAVMGDVRQFAEQLRARGLQVIYEPEIMSTIQAERLQGQRSDIDASAAAVILQSYLDRLKKISRSAESRAASGQEETLEDIENRKYTQTTRFD